MGPLFALILLAIPLVIVTMVAALYPIIRILDRMGFPKRNVILYYLPLVNVIFIWRLALQPWPIETPAGYTEVFH